MSSSQISQLSFKTVLIANRGEIAIRLIKAVHALKLCAATVYVSDDSTSPHIRSADITYKLGSSHTLYNDVSAVVTAGKQMNADAVLPGYGFLSENPDAATAFEKAGIVWLGPTPETIDLFGLKHTARKAAVEAGVPVIPGSSLLSSLEEARAAVENVGFPVLFKATSGGGGMGQAIARKATQVDRAYHSVVNQAASLFSTSQLYVERYIEHARHIEVQVFGDGCGRVVALGDRDCSVQRRRQKVIEEAHAPALPIAVRNALREKAAAFCAQHKYRSAGTVEFILDAHTNEWFFLEVNTRLQVEHGITEMVSGVDIVRAMILLGAGIDVWSTLPNSVPDHGVAMEARIYAENPVKGYVPSPGTVSELVWPDENACSFGTTRIRVDNWAEHGTLVAPHYDPMLGKVLAWGATRPLAIIALKEALSQTVVRGVDCNIELLLQVLSHPQFLQGNYTTDLLTFFKPATKAVEVVEPGVQSSLQDYPGRVGYWDIGVSPSGPMDAYAMGMANALVGNPSHACALEMTVSGPTLWFHSDCVIALTGASFNAVLDEGRHVDFWKPFSVSAGSKLVIGRASALSSKNKDTSHLCGGRIAYLAVRGGFDAPKYLGSASTFPTGKFGGLKGSFLAAGDFLPLGKTPSSELDHEESNGLEFRWPLGKPLDERFIPYYNCEEWTIAALNGPHASPDFLEEESLSELWTASYEVHHATNRLGARLIGPAPKWTRSDGGSAGLHPSNLHDYTYAPGAVNFSGNTPIVLMLDGPSLGGFVCPITVATAEFWKVAQAAPGDFVRFKQVDYDQATSAFLEMEKSWDAVRYYDIDKLDDIANRWCPWWIKECSEKHESAILAQLKPEQGDSAEIKTVYRMSGDEHILIEYGEIELNLAYRLHVHMLMDEIKKESFVKELCPGVRSLLLHYDRKLIHVKKLVSHLIKLEADALGSVEDVVVPSRTIKLPLAFNDRWTKEAQARYTRSVRSEAPYLPSNVEFMRRINGLESVDEVKQLMVSAEYMVLGLGDVYLGAPCAVPVDPRHRMVTSKYNPARTYTPEGAVGIGGTYMCIYGMDSPGGYQLAGRTLPIWDNFGTIPEECRGAPSNIPWLLRFFDRVKFFPVSDDELEEMRTRFRNGDYKINIMEGKFSYAEHKQFLEAHSDSIHQFETKRGEAYNEERSRWEQKGEGGNVATTNRTNGAQEDGRMDNGETEENNESYKIPDAGIAIFAGMSATVWSIDVKDGDMVEKGDELVTLESMKVEISIDAPATGRIERVFVQKGDHVKSDDMICVFVIDKDVSQAELTIMGLQEQYRLGTADVKEVLRESVRRAREVGTDMFAVIRSEDELEGDIKSIIDAKEKRKYMPLFGIPFLLSDSIDFSGMQTCGGGRRGDYNASKTSPLVSTLLDAGAILVGKTRSDKTCQVENPKQADSRIGGIPCAVMSMKKKVSAFVVDVDKNGSTTMPPAICGVIGMKASEGLLPLRADVENWIPNESVALYTCNYEDLEFVLEVCKHSRQKDDVVSASRVLRPFAPTSKQKSHGWDFHRLLVGRFSDSVLAELTDGFSAAAYVYTDMLEELRRDGLDIRQIDMNCLTSALSVLRDSQFDGSRNENSADCNETRLRLEVCKREADLKLWSAVDVVMFPVTQVLDEKHGIHLQNVNPFGRLTSAMNLCSLTIPTKQAGFDSNKVHVIVSVAQQMKENLLIQLASSYHA